MARSFFFSGSAWVYWNTTTQRISTIRHADQILVLDRGLAVGLGTHDELMQNCDVYREIALSQLSAAELAEGGKTE